VKAKDRKPQYDYRLHRFDPTLTKDWTAPQIEGDLQELKKQIKRVQRSAESTGFFFSSVEAFLKDIGITTAKMVKTSNKME